MLSRLGFFRDLFWFDVKNISCAMSQFPGSGMDRHGLSRFLYRLLTGFLSVFDHKKGGASHVCMENQIPFLSVFLDNYFIGGSILSADAEESFRGDKPVEFFIPFPLFLLLGLFLRRFFKESGFLL